MIRQPVRVFRVYGAAAAMMPKLFVAYQFRIWFNVVIEILALAITVAFWRAVYTGRETVGGLTAAQTLNYVMLARIFHDGTFSTTMIREFGELIREGGILTALLRPLDFQSSMYLQKLALHGLNTMMRMPLALFAWLFFDLHFPGEPVVWAAAAVTLLLGQAIMFCFDWILACAVFYITDAWGLATARSGIATFFSGMLIPLGMMPEWLRAVALALPFSQAVYLPISVLSGLTSVADLPRVWLAQLLYLAVLLVPSRLIFNRAVRVVTVQGG
jgi:ABC-2 type transport system permease protein